MFEYLEQVDKDVGTLGQKAFDTELLRSSKLFDAVDSAARMMAHARYLIEQSKELIDPIKGKLDKVPEGDGEIGYFHDPDEVSMDVENISFVTWLARLRLSELQGTECVGNSEETLEAHRKYPPSEIGELSSFDQLKKHQLEVEESMAHELERLYGNGFINEDVMPYAQPIVNRLIAAIADAKAVIKNNGDKEQAIGNLQTALYNAKGYLLIAGLPVEKHDHDSDWVRIKPAYV